MRRRFVRGIAVTPAGNGFATCRCRVVHSRCRPARRVAVHAQHYWRPATRDARVTWRVTPLGPVARSATRYSGQRDAWQHVVLIARDSLMRSNPTVARDATAHSTGGERAARAAMHDATPPSRDIVRMSRGSAATGRPAACGAEHAAGSCIAAALLLLALGYV